MNIVLQILSKMIFLDVLNLDHLLNFHLTTIHDQKLQTHEVLNAPSLDSTQVTCRGQGGASATVRSNNENLESMDGPDASKVV